MKLSAIVASYIDFKRSLGMSFRTDNRVLKAFSRAMGDVEIDNVKPDAVRMFIDGRGPVTAFWHQKHKILRSFYRYVVNRGHTTTSPLPRTIPKCPPPLMPYIYSLEELRRLLAATDTLHSPQSPLQALTFRTLLLLLYGTGMRIGEALSLTMSDVDLPESLVTVRDAKFHKSRLVPTGPKLTEKLSAYATERRSLPLPNGGTSAFFATRTGNAVSYHRVNTLFRRLRALAEVWREPDARYQPRLHDLRHAAAVHRLIAWYRAGADVQRWLLPLSTYLGHVEIASTQRYLTMTPELLRQAGLRFERYAQESDVRHE